MTNEEIQDLCKQSYIEGAKNVASVLKKTIDDLVIVLENEIKEGVNQ